MSVCVITAQMFYEDVYITPTDAQLLVLEGPPSIESLKIADFLERQFYIDDWIGLWLKSSEWNPEDLPLCVSESIICDPKLQKKYVSSVKDAIIRNDIQWLQRHCILPVESGWNVVNFHTVTMDMFDFLWSKSKVPLKLCSFLAQSRNLEIWTRFVNEYGPDSCIEDVAKQQWYAGFEYCVTEGAVLEDVVKYCVRSAKMFKLITVYNPEATAEAWEEFCLQRILSRVEDVILVEEWFFVHGYKTEYTNVTYMPNVCTAF